jgi:hypothetical protein
MNYGPGGISALRSGSLEIIIRPAKGWLAKQTLIGRAQTRNRVRT